MKCRRCGRRGVGFIFLGEALCEECREDWEGMLRDLFPVWMEPKVWKEFNQDCEAALDRGKDV
jgi:hypothetical protein